MAASNSDVRFTPNSGHPSAQSKCPLWADIVAKRFLVPERGIIFQERVRMENIDLRIPSFGFCYCLLQRVDGSLADFCNTICQKQTFGVRHVGSDEINAGLLKSEQEKRVTTKRSIFAMTSLAPYSRRALTWLVKIRLVVSLRSCSLTRPRQSDIVVTTLTWCFECDAGFSATIRPIRR